MLNKEQEKHDAPESALHNLIQGTPLCSEVPLFKIDNQGHWRYLNSPLPAKFSKLFSTILHRVDDEYFLITPVEKLKVEVADSVFTVVDYDKRQNGNFEVTTSIGTKFSIADLSCFELSDDRIKVFTERELPAILGRACYYRFIDEFVHID
ncbi:DUF1285 domain-containing protein [Shewanella gelidii]|uniref:DUF1285 domain-containing protein n=1 Tax=Shewanella gelidii TaxID=1642821 RepID=A0A917JWV2_9GAMM|nr:DUF1285 domain-containing protein [Shewanella gelidii]MCL1098995.1 DUF1285 domain-containing protein [Shewanella gelidii]GGI88992.1 DUF1285 domain-containing protein [Shewanella gelidii]